MEPWRNFHRQILSTYSVLCEGNQKNIEKKKKEHRGILRIETALTGVSVSGRTVRRLFT